MNIVSNETSKLSVVNLENDKIVLLAEKKAKIAKELSFAALSDIRTVGSEIQQEISANVDDIVDRCKVLDCGEAGKALQELSIVTDQQNNSLIPKTFNGMMMGFKKFIGKYKSAGEHLNKVITQVETSKDNLLLSLDDLERLVNTATRAYYDLQPYEEALGDSVDVSEIALKEIDSESLEYLQEQRKMQSLKRRQEDLATTRVVAYQTVKQALLLIMGNQALADQMQYAIDNVIPLWKTQIITSANAKMQTDALELRKNVSKAVNNLLVENAKSIAKNVKDVKALTDDTIIDVKKLQEVDKIMHDLAVEMSSKSVENLKKHKEIMSTLETLKKEADSRLSLQSDSVN